MAWYESLSNLFDPVLTPIFFFILKMPPALGIITIAFIITMISTLIYKWVTDQDVMKSLKDEMKSLQKQVKEHSKNKDITKMNEMNKIMMERNMQYMKHSFRPMMFTMLPLLIIFGWVGGHLAYEPLNPDTEFNISVNFAHEVNSSLAKITVPQGMEIIGESEKEIKGVEVRNGFLARTFGDDYRTERMAEWTLKGQEGDYAVQIDYNGSSYEKFVQITDEKRYAQVTKFVQDDKISVINVENEKVKLFGLNWFWTYFIAAIIFSTIERKILKLS